MDERQELRSLKRGLKALALLNQLEVISISELARKLALPRTTAERILLTLASEGYVHRIEDDKRYRLSLKVCALARGFSDESWVTHVASPLLFEFTKLAGWPVAIATPSGINMSVRLTTDPATSLWLTRRRIGSEVPMLNSSSGLLYLAYSQAAERSELLQMMSQSGRTLMLGENVDLDRSFDQVRRDGFSFSPHAAGKEDSISVPIIIDGQVRAVLLMMYMTRAMRRSEVLRKYLEPLRHLSASIVRGGEEDDAPPAAVPQFAPRPSYGGGFAVAAE